MQPNPKRTKVGMGLFSTRKTHESDDEDPDQLIAELLQKGKPKTRPAPFFDDDPRFHGERTPSNPPEAMQDDTPRPQFVRSEGKTPYLQPLEDDEETKGGFIAEFLSKSKEKGKAKEQPEQPIADVSLLVKPFRTASTSTPTQASRSPQPSKTTRPDEASSRPSNRARTPAPEAGPSSGVASSTNTTSSSPQPAPNSDRQIKALPTRKLQQPPPAAPLVASTQPTTSNPVPTATPAQAAARSESPEGEHGTYEETEDPVPFGIYTLVQQFRARFPDPSYLWGPNSIIFKVRSISSAIADWKGSRDPDLSFLQVQEYLKQASPQEVKRARECVYRARTQSHWLDEPRLSTVKDQLDEEEESGTEDFLLPILEAKEDEGSSSQTSSDGSEEEEEDDMEQVASIYESPATMAGDGDTRVPRVPSPSNIPSPLFTQATLIDSSALPIGLAIPPIDTSTHSLPLLLQSESDPSSQGSPPSTESTPLVETPPLHPELDQAQIADADNSTGDVSDYESQQLQVPPPSMQPPDSMSNEDKDKSGSHAAEGDGLLLRKSSLEPAQSESLPEFVGEGGLPSSKESNSGSVTPKAMVITGDAENGASSAFLEGSPRGTASGASPDPGLQPRQMDESPDEILGSENASFHEGYTLAQTEDDTQMVQSPTGSIPMSTSVSMDDDGSDILPQTIPRPTFDFPPSQIRQPAWDLGNNDEDELMDTLSTSRHRFRYPGDSDDEDFEGDFVMSAGQPSAVATTVEDEYDTFLNDGANEDSESLPASPMDSVHETGTEASDPLCETEEASAEHDNSAATIPSFPPGISDTTTMNEAKPLGHWLSGQSVKMCSDGESEGKEDGSVDAANAGVDVEDDEQAPKNDSGTGEVSPNDDGEEEGEVVEQVEQVENTREEEKREVESGKEDEKEEQKQEERLDQGAEKAEDSAPQPESEDGPPLPIAVNLSSRHSSPRRRLAGQFVPVSKQFLGHVPESRGKIQAQAPIPDRDGHSRSPNLNVSPQTHQPRN
ncbi:hypothetical protein CC2G_004074 [Coprinopsis cinerea AmutBmut pab1-1]|nr:hypothetical protein CC2G_004074 [Coprinopsis cinerea AmutBmut pab1-1]KAG2003473.1 hypothetical protein CC2G_004074 [Coprinopsis cinerea AmutBmut pab1-1]